MRFIQLIKAKGYLEYMRNTYHNAGYAHLDAEVSTIFILTIPFKDILVLGCKHSIEVV